VTGRHTLPAPECAEAASIRRIASICRDRRARGRLLGYARTLDRVPHARRSVILAAIGVHEPALSHIPTEPVDLPKAAGYPRVVPVVAARLILGERPVDLAPGLTKREARAWLCNGAPPVAEWYLEQHEVPGAVYDLAVARWLVARWRKPEQREALERPRAEVIAGQRIEGCYLDRVDELRRGDLTTSVEATFRRAARRLTRQMERALESRGEPLRAPPRWWRPVRCARLLLSGQDLVREGRALDHCVGVYADSVRSGRSVLIGICVLGQRSTAELDPETLHVRQHRGYGNGEPPALCQRALEVCLRRWRAAKEGT